MPPLRGRGRSNPRLGVSAAASPKTGRRAQPPDACVNFIEPGASLWERGKDSSLELSETALSKRVLYARDRL